MVKLIETKVTKKSDSRLEEIIDTVKYNKYGWYLDDNKNRHFKDSKSFDLLVDMLAEGKLTIVGAV